MMTKETALNLANAIDTGMLLVLPMGIVVDNGVDKQIAETLRKYAARFDDRNDPMAVCFCDKDGWHPNHAEIDVQRMLIQGAEMIERCEELMKQCVVICGKQECDHKGDKCIQCARPVIRDIRDGNDSRCPEGSAKPKDWKAMLNQLATIMDYMPFVIDALSAQQAECNPSGETMMKCAEFIEKIKKMEKNDE